jgi:hypothetical protein
MVMVRRAQVPKDIMKALRRAWPDGVIEMIDLDEVPAWGAYSALKLRLLRISGSELVYEREAEGGLTHAVPSTPIRSSRTKMTWNDGSPDRGGSATAWRCLWWRPLPSSH